MASKKGRTVHSWQFPAGYYFKCVAAALRDEGLRGKALLAEFEKMIPAWKRFFPGEISSTTVVDRADKARRYKSENPETHPVMARMWEQAVRDAKARRKWKYSELNAAFVISAEGKRAA